MKSGLLTRISGLLISALLLYGCTGSSSKTPVIPQLNPLNNNNFPQGPGLLPPGVGAPSPAAQKEIQELKQLNQIEAQLNEKGIRFQNELVCEEAEKSEEYSEEYKDESIPAGCLTQIIYPESWNNYDPLSGVDIETITQVIPLLEEYHSAASKSSLVQSPISLTVHPATKAEIQRKNYVTKNAADFLEVRKDMNPLIQKEVDLNEMGIYFGHTQDYENEEEVWETVYHVPQRWRDFENLTEQEVCTIQSAIVLVSEYRQLARSFSDRIKPTSHPLGEILAGRKKAGRELERFLSERIDPEIQYLVSLSREIEELGVVLTSRYLDVNRDGQLELFPYVLWNDMKTGIPSVLTGLGESSFSQVQIENLQNAVGKLEEFKSAAWEMLSGKNFSHAAYSESFFDRLSIQIQSADEAQKHIQYRLLEAIIVEIKAELHETHTIFFQKDPKGEIRGNGPVAEDLDDEQKTAAIEKLKTLLKTIKDLPNYRTQYTDPHLHKNLLNHCRGIVLLIRRYES